MPAATSFSCLWCGTAHTAESPDDLEGWARLCPDCLGRAGENAFLRRRLRAALDARSRAAEAAEATRRRRIFLPPPPDDWYLRRGGYGRGPVHDQAFAAELDAAGRWLDGLPISGDIVQLATGTGWWSTLLAGRGTLTALEATGEPLDRARERLLAHGLRAHLHVRDPWAEPDRAADDVVLAVGLARLVADERPAYLDVARRWLRPGGTLALIEPADDPAGALPDGLRAPFSSPAEFEAALGAAGFAGASAATTGRFFLIASARA